MLAKSRPVVSSSAASAGILLAVAGALVGAYTMFQYSMTSPMVLRLPGVDPEPYPTAIVVGCAVALAVGLLMNLRQSVWICGACGYSYRRD